MKTQIDINSEDIYISTDFLVFVLFVENIEEILAN
jgi:hypothetical protein